MMVSLLLDQSYQDTLSEGMACRDNINITSHHNIISTAYITAVCLVL